MAEILMTRKALKRARISCDGFMKGLKEVIANGWNPEDNLELLDQMTEARDNFIKCYDDVIVLHDDGGEDEQKDIDAKDKAIVDYLRGLNEFKSYRTKFKENLHDRDLYPINKREVLDSAFVDNIDNVLETNLTKIEDKDPSTIKKCDSDHNNEHSKSEPIDIKVEKLEYDNKYTKEMGFVDCKDKKSVIDKIDKKSNSNKHMKNCSIEKMKSKKIIPTCEHCMKTFKRKNSLKVHLNTHIKKELRTIVGTCSVCDKTFYSSKASLNVHMRKCNKEQIERKRIRKIVKQCNQCEYSSRSFSNLNRHVERVHIKIKKRKKTNCDNCDYYSHDTYSLRKHMEKCQRRLEKEKKISKLRNSHFCNYFSERPSDMRKHIARCQRVLERERMKKARLDLPLKHVCQICGKTFQNKSSVEIHEMSHSKVIETPLQCHLCLNFFKTKDFLENHLKNHSRFEETYEDLLQGRDKIQK